MTLLELADLVADLIKKHGPDTKVRVWDELTQKRVFIDGTYKLSNPQISDKKPIILLIGD